MRNKARIKLVKRLGPEKVGNTSPVPNIAKDKVTTIPIINQLANKFLPGQKYRIKRASIIKINAAANKMSEFSTSLRLVAELAVLPNSIEENSEH